ncbi:MAG: hypothetical protein AAF533_18795 [Acidobacteriota bacterium]
MSDLPIQPHGPLRSLAPGLHVVEGRWKRSPLGRRMTVLETEPGRVALHASMRLDEAGTTELMGLGRPAWILVPNDFHSSEAGALAEAWPDARVLIHSGASGATRAGLPRIDGTIAEAWPESLSGRLEATELAGLSFHESAFLHVATRTLVLTDLCFNFARDDASGLLALILRINGVLGRFRPSRLLRFAFLKDRHALLDSLEPVLAWDFDRVVVSHGSVLEAGGKEAFTRALEVIRA